MARGMKNNNIYFCKQSSSVGKGGRPRLVLNQDGEKLIEDLYSIMCKDDEVEGIIGADIETLKAEHNIERFSRAQKKGQSMAKSSLRRAQFKSALSGNIPMQIWLGKQILGQREPRDESERNDQNESFNALVKVIDNVRKAQS